MARGLSANARKVLRELGDRRKPIDELRRRTGIPKYKLAKVLWHLCNGGWVAVGEEVRKTPVFKRVRVAPKADAATGRSRSESAPHIAALQAAFGIRLPPKRAQGRTVRPGRG